MNTGLKLLRTAESLLEDPDQRVKLNGSNESHLLHSIEVHSCHAAIATEAGDFNMSLEHFQKGLDIFNQALSMGYVHVDDAPHHILLGGIGNSLNGLGRNIEAEKAFLKCLNNKVSRTKFTPHEINICRTLLAQHKLQEAERRLQEVINRRRQKFGPDDAQSYLCLLYTSDAADE